MCFHEKWAHGRDNKGGKCELFVILGISVQKWGYVFPGATSLDESHMWHFLGWFCKGDCIDNNVSVAGDEMFSDTYRMKLVDEVIYEVTGTLIQRKAGDIQLDGANPSAEEADEGTDEAVESGVDVVLNHRLCETGFSDKKSYTAYLKDYMKK